MGVPESAALHQVAVGGQRGGLQVEAVQKAGEFGIVAKTVYFVGDKITFFSSSEYILMFCKHVRVTGDLLPDPKGAGLHLAFQFSYVRTTDNRVSDRATKTRSSR